MGHNLDAPTAQDPPMDNRPRHLRLVVDNGVNPHGQRRRRRFTHADRIERAALLRRVCAEYESWSSLSDALEEYGVERDQRRATSPRPDARSDTERAIDGWRGGGE
jgi:hypothetical protein